MKLTPIAEILRRAGTLPTLGLRAKYINGHIASERGDNIHRTSVRIRELQAALSGIQMRRLKRERAA